MFYKVSTTRICGFYKRNHDYLTYSNNNIAVMIIATVMIEMLVMIVVTVTIVVIVKMIVH